MAQKRRAVARKAVADAVSKDRENEAEAKRLLPRDLVERCFEESPNEFAAGVHRLPDEILARAVSRPGRELGHVIADARQLRG